MESKYLLELTELVYRCGTGFRCMKAMQRCEEAASRIQKRISRKDTIVAVRIKNPRYSIKD